MDPNIKAPTNPRDAGAWRAGRMSTAFIKYTYCQTDPETLNTIANSQSGLITADKKFKIAPLTWRTIAQFNYGTDDPGELNWYLKNFNGCTKVDLNGNFVLDKADASPFFFLPVVAITAAGTVTVPPGTPATVTAPPPHTELTDAAKRRFNDIDVGKSGFLKKSDIQNNLKGSAFTGTDAAMLATMWLKFSDMEDFSDDEFGPETNGISRADLNALERIMSGTATDKANAVVNTYLFFKAKVSAASTTLYTTPAIDSFMTAQGVVGDCWFLSAIVALKDRGDGIVRTAIVPSGSDFVVTFKGHSGSITVTKPTDPQIALVAATQGNGLWLTVLELALGWMNNSTDPIDGVDTGNVTGKGIELITGNSSTDDTLSFTRDSVTRDKLEKAMTAGKAVTASVIHIPLISDESRNGWPNGHCYSILAFDRGADKVRVRNPWGRRNSDTDTAARPSGQEITFAEFTKNWTDVAYED
jgi:hypothetical protein